MILPEKTDAAFDAIYDIHVPSFKLWERAPKGVLREQFDKGVVFVSYLYGEKRIAGYAILTEKLGEPYLWEIAVDPLHRGRGIGPQLLAEVEQWAWKNEKRAINLNVTVENPAQKIYFNAGYRVEKVLRGYYGAGRNGMTMRREF